MVRSAARLHLVRRPVVPVASHPHVIQQRMQFPAVLAVKGLLLALVLAAVARVARRVLVVMAQPQLLEQAMVALAGRVPMAPAVLVVQAALLALVVRAVQINSVVVVVVVQKALLAHRQVVLVAYQVALVVGAQVTAGEAHAAHRRLWFW